MMQVERRNWATLAALAGLALVLAGWGALQGTASGAKLLPHGYCFTWDPTLLWSHVIGDTLIGLAYVSIPLTLLHIVLKRRELPFGWIAVLFAVFITSCGVTHLIDVWTVWQPVYWLSAAVRIITAVASVLTALVLVRQAPLILALPTTAQLKQAKQALEAEVAHRRAAEEALLRERAELARRVQERTHELAQATTVAEAAHAAADEANRMKDRFLAKVSHELRTPLQSTLSWAQVLRQSTLDPERTTQAADRIIHNVNTQARLIDDLLDISTILSGKLSLRPERVRAGSVIGKAADMVRPVAAQRHVSIEVSGDETTATATAIATTDAGPAQADVLMDTDPVRLQQVVWNLIHNAVQASPDGGRVAVRHHASDGHLFIEVQDWGRGIASEDLPHLFEPFRSGLADHAPGGLGLGLAITRSIVDMLGGELHVHSDGPGHGALFSLKLPMAVGAERAQTDPSAPLNDDERSELAGLHVLYVEDEADIAESGRLVLTELGLHVTACMSYQDAARQITSQRFDMLLSDLNLGAGHTALDLLNLMRSLPQGQDVPAIVLSAYGSQEDRKASERAGFAGHVVKPAESTCLARTMLEVLHAEHAV
ncbi:MAG: ATP-binding protein [Aquabacterium sp.]